MNNRLTYSRLEDHNVYQKTDHLYDPLRSILLQHDDPKDGERENISLAVRQSRVTQDFRYLREQEMHELAQKNRTLIPVDRPLVPTHNLEKVRGTKFIALDAEQRVIGAPISPQQMNMIRSQGFKEEKVVYDFQEEQKDNQIRPPPSPPNIILPTQQIQQPEPQKTKYRSPPIEQEKPKSPYKYNLYSMIDEPANRIRQFGCGACTCPANDIIAPRNKPKSLKWLGD